MAKFIYALTSAGAYRTSNGAYTALAPVDDFEDGDLAEYTVNPTEVYANATAAHSGSYGIQMDGATGNSGTIRSDSGLENYPGKTDSIQIWWNTQTIQQQFSIYWAVQSGSDLSECYRSPYNLNLSTYDVAVEFQERGNNGNNYIDAGNTGATSDSAAKKMNITTGTWYRTVYQYNGDDTWDVWVDTGEGTSRLGVDYTTATTQYNYGPGAWSFYISGQDNVYCDDIVILPG